MDNNTGYCLFSISSNGQTAIGISGSGDLLEVTLCLNGKGPVSCQIYSHQISTPVTNTQYSYIDDFNSNPGTINFCELDRQTGAFINCNVATTSLNLQAPYYLSINPAGTYLYAVSGGSIVSSCPIRSDHTLGTCVVSSPSGAGALFGAAITSTGTRLYSPNNGGTPAVSVCEVSGTSVSTCTDTGGGIATNSTPQGIAISENTAYITLNNAHKVTKCTIDASNGLFTSCTDTVLNTGGAPTGIAVNSDNSYAYIAINDGATGVLVCPITNGVWTCNLVVGITPFGLVINKTDTAIYLTDFSQSVYECPITSPGQIGTCTQVYDLGSGTAVALGITDSNT